MTNRHDQSVDLERLANAVVFALLLAVLTWCARPWALSAENFIVGTMAAALLSAHLMHPMIGTEPEERVNAA